MKNTSITLKTTIITIVLLAIAGASFAGAVQRRGGSDDRARQEDSKASEPRKDNNTDKSRSYKPSDSNAKAKDRPAAKPSTSKKPDAEPSRRRSEDSRADRNRDDRSRNDDHGRNARNYNDRRDSDNKYDRVKDRGDDSKSYRPGYPTTYRPPSRYKGYYRYDHGWTSRRNFACNYGYWVFDSSPGYSVRSAYYYYGYFPYLPSARIVIVSRPKTIYKEVPISVRYRPQGGYYLEDSRNGEDAIGFVLSDIQNAWISSEPYLLLNYVNRNQRIDVALDGKYAYTIDGDDYADMTQDAIRASNTISFEFDSVRSRGDNRFVAYGRHEFYSVDGYRKTVFVSYLFERQGREWVITEVGSSPYRLTN